MRKLLLTLALCLLPSLAAAQCANVGGVNNVPQPGIVCLNEPAVDSYAAAGFGIVPAANATDVACITGSATKVIRLQWVKVSGTAGTLVTLPVLVNKHTVANTGGTPATTTALPTPMKLDSNSGSATATTTAYTANPTVDSSATQMDMQTVSFNTTSALVSGPAAFFDYRNHPYMMAPTLRGVAQQYCVNFGGISVSSGLIAVSFGWSEAAQ